MSGGREPNPRRQLTPGNWIAIAGVAAVFVGPGGFWACEVNSRLGTLEGQAQAVLKADEALRELDAADRIEALERALTGAGRQEGTTDGE